MAKTYRVALLGGDGTGPEVALEGKKVLDAAAAKYEWLGRSYDVDGTGQTDGQLNAYLAMAQRAGLDAILG